MTITNLVIPLDTDTAQLYANASVEDQKKIQLLLGFWLREFTMSPTSLAEIMDKISEKASSRGLTPEILESLLSDN